ncbi:MAG: zinc-ribbon domain-containing protein [Clostridia bacterium]|nr:zinc-ribbon domain-containing protein [Clostridia bacterium]
MFCSHCGKELNNEAVVCPHCGILTGNSGFDKAATGYQQPSQGYQQPYQGYQQPMNNGMPNKYTQGYQGYQGYQNPYQQQPPQPKVNNVCGIVGFVFALLSLYFGAYICIPCIVGLVLSIIGMVHRKKCTACNGLAIAGLVISIITLVFWLIVWMIFGSIIFFELIYGFGMY